MFFRLISSFVGVLVVCPPAALAIDFNIDIPAPAGATPAGPRMDRNSSIQSDADQDENEELGGTNQDDADDANAGLSNSQDGGLAPENNPLVQLPPLPDTFRPRIYETESFPVPVCLDSNVTFWKRIYRDTDVNHGSASWPLQTQKNIMSSGCNAWQPRLVPRAQAKRFDLILWKRSCLPHFVRRTGIIRQFLQHPCAYVFSPDSKVDLRAGFGGPLSSCQRLRQSWSLPAYRAISSICPMSKVAMFAQLDRKLVP
jgi:hypothetical protein